MKMKRKSLPEVKVSLDKAYKKALMSVNHDVHPCYASNEKEFISLLSSHEISEPCSHSEKPSSTQ